MIPFDRATSAAAPAGPSTAHRGTRAGRSGRDGVELGDVRREVDEHVGLGGVGVRHRDLDVDRAPDGREQVALRQLLRQPVDAVDGEQLRRGRERRRAWRRRSAARSAAGPRRW